MRKADLIFKRTEAALELVAQQSIQLTMLLLSMTKYPVVTGLQGIIGKDCSKVETFLGLNLGGVLLLLSICESPVMMYGASLKSLLDSISAS